MGGDAACWRGGRFGLGLKRVCEMGMRASWLFLQHYHAVGGMRGLASWT